MVIWFFGLSGAGKSTLASILAERLRAEGVPAVQLDGDELRRGLCSDLGFSGAARRENLRRAAHVAKFLVSARQVVVVSMITPLEADRRCIEEVLGEDLRFVFVRTSLEECERRDPKGLYRRARAGEILQFTGVSAPFEEPCGGLEIDTEEFTPEEAVDYLLDHLDAG